MGASDDIVELTGKAEAAAEKAAGGDKAEEKRAVRSAVTSQEHGITFGIHRSYQFAERSLG